MKDQLEGGYIKSWRKTADSKVFNDNNHLLFKIWMWCLWKANWKRSEFNNRTIEPGTFVTGRNKAADELYVSGSSWYRAMQRLQEIGNIKMESVNNRFTLVHIVNWRVYQSEDDGGRTTNEQPTDNQRTTSGQPVIQPADTIEEVQEREEGKEFKEHTHTLGLHGGNPDFVHWWTSFLGMLRENKGKNPPFQQQQIWLMDLSRLSAKKAIENLKFSISIGASRVIDSDDDFSKQRPNQQKKNTVTAAEAAEGWG